MRIVFWQSMVTRHQAALVRALSMMPDVDVTYVAAEEVDARRAGMGWTAPDLGKATLHMAPDASSIARLAAGFGPEDVHLCQGFRGNGVIETALPSLAARGARIGVMMEAVDQRGLSGSIKLPVYWSRIRKFRGQVRFCLAVGQDAAAFVARCGFPEERIFPFTYFTDPPAPAESPETGGFRLVYAGQLVQLKRVDLLIDAVASLDRPDVRLSIAGDGPMLAELKTQVDKKLDAQQVEWLGTLPPDEVQTLIQRSDCLVLPSEYDGWGAVVSEALLAGVPAICSDACGAAEAVRGSHRGGIFRSGDAADLAGLLRQQLQAGAPDRPERQTIAAWAEASLSGAAGGQYLTDILRSAFGQSPAPKAPWLT